MTIHTKVITELKLKPFSNDEENSERIIRVEIRHETKQGISIHVNPLKIVREGRFLSTQYCSRTPGVKFVTSEMITRFSQKKFDNFKIDSAKLNSMILQTLQQGIFELQDSNILSEVLNAA